MLYRMGEFRPAPLLAAGALLLLVVVVARGESAVPSTPAEWRPPEVPPRPITPGALTPDTTGVFQEPPANGSWVLDLVVGLVVMVLVVSFLLFVHAMLRARGRRRARGTVGEYAGTVANLKDALEQARDVLTRPGREPRDAVIRAWVTLENATEHGRAPHQTATEFTVSLLEKENADEEALRELRTLYHRARFGRRTGEAAAAAATAALDRILATIR